MDDSEIYKVRLAIEHIFYRYPKCLRSSTRLTLREIYANPSGWRSPYHTKSGAQVVCEIIKEVTHEKGAVVFSYAPGSTIHWRPFGG